MLEAYFDESERTDGTFCVAGFAFAPIQAKRFCKEWRAALGKDDDGEDRLFHMKELIPRKGAFEGWTQPKVDRLLRNTVSIIQDRMTVGVGIACRIDEFNEYAPKWIRGFGHAYSVCCHFAMTQLGIWMADTGYQGDVAYIFEAGHRFAAEAGHLMTEAQRDPTLNRSYRYRSHAFVPKPDATPLQAADFLAWEWAKCVDETITIPIRPPRGSLRALLNTTPMRYRLVNITGHRLRRFMLEIHGMGRHQLWEAGKIPLVELPRPWDYATDDE